MWTNWTWTVASRRVDSVSLRGAEVCSGVSGSRLGCRGVWQMRFVKKYNAAAEKDAFHENAGFPTVTPINKTWGDGFKLDLCLQASNDELNGWTPTSSDGYWSRLRPDHLKYYACHDHRVGTNAQHQTHNLPRLEPRPLLCRKAERDWRLQRRVVLSYWTALKLSRRFIMTNLIPA